MRAGVRASFWARRLEVSSSGGLHMSLLGWLLVILLVVALLGGGGYYYRRW
jgi:hypothetical protein